MINRTKGLLYTPFIYFKGDVFAVNFHFHHQVFILELLMLWGIPHSTRDHEYDTHLFVVRLPSSQRKSFRRGSVFKDRKPSGTVTQWANKLHLCSPTGSGCKRQPSTGQELTPALVPELQGRATTSQLLCGDKQTLKQIHVALRTHRYHTTFGKNSFHHCK